MRITRNQALFCLVLATSALADTGADRLQLVMSSRLELQRTLRAQLEEMLRPIVAPHRVHVVVDATMDARLRENVRSEESPGTEVNVRPMRQVELPGLPVVRQQIVGAGTPQMEYKVPGRKVTEKTTTLDAEVAKLTVRVFLDPAVSEATRTEVKRMVTAMAGLDTARGDVLELAELPPLPVAGLVDRLPAAWLYSLTALVAALLVALGLSRRARASQAEVRVGTEGTRRDDDVEEAEEAAGPDPEARPERAEAGAALVGGPFAALATCSPDELAQVVVELPSTEAAVLLAATQVEPRAARRVFELLPMERQLAMGQWMGTQHELSRDEVERIAKEASGALDKVRSRVTLGGAELLADLLAQAPEQTVKRMLEELGGKDPQLVAAVRRRMPLFEDLGALEAKAIRAVATQLDPARLALALATAPQPLKERVYTSVSKRLRAMLESEGEGLKSPPAAQVEEARKQVELVMRRLRVQKSTAVPAAA